MQLTVMQVPMIIYIVGADGGYAVLIPLSQFPKPDDVDDVELHAQLVYFREHFLRKAIVAQWDTLVQAYNKTLATHTELPEPTPTNEAVRASTITIAGSKNMDSLRNTDESTTWVLDGEYVFVTKSSMEIEHFLTFMHTGPLN